MPYTPGDVIRITNTMRDSQFQGVFRNIVHFRGFEGSLLDSQAQLIIDAFLETWMDRMRLHLRNTTYQRHIRVQNMSYRATPDIEQYNNDNDFNGAVVTNDDDVPQAACCFIRRSYQNGRKGIGRYFHGPLPSSFASKGEVVVDPTGLGDLNDVMDALGDPLVVGTATFRPIVIGATETNGLPKHDIRICTAAPLVTYLRSRRPGQGE